MIAVLRTVSFHSMTSFGDRHRTFSSRHQVMVRGTLLPLVAPGQLCSVSDAALLWVSGLPTESRGQPNWASRSHASHLRSAVSSDGQGARAGAKAVPGGRLAMTSRWALDAAGIARIVMLVSAALIL